jgi:hypothetical protein
VQIDELIYLIKLSVDIAQKRTNSEAVAMSEVSQAPSQKVTLEDTASHDDGVS